MNDDKMYIQINNPDNLQYSVIIDEDGETVYFYLLYIQKIVSDVWLYNTGPSPEYVDWDNPEIMPFPSPIGLSKPDLEIIRIMNNEKLKVLWGTSANENKITADLYFDNKHIASLTENHRPGKSVNALVDSPLALRLN